MELMKLNFILAEGSNKVYRQEYISYVHVLTVKGMNTGYKIDLHECSMNLIAELLLNESFKSSYLKEYDTLIRGLKNKYLPLKMCNLSDEKSKT